ncbi:MAG TPA: glycine--tRNA ligase [Candidatus Dormibacteraeota bacterium]|nr:glycine--tRNA ligase [Candidatus Dormibacteraeota bacterium]
MTATDPAATSAQPAPPAADVVEKLVSLSKQRGFVFQSSEIYGGINALYDFGPLGTRLRRNIRDSWWRRMIELRDDVEPIESSIIMHPRVWEASGHVQNFTDPLVDCTGKCRRRWREDHLEEERRVRGKDPSQRLCPECDGALTEARNFNLMFKTFAGPVEDASTQVWLRPETAQGMFVDFQQVVNATRARMPFGIAQIGKAFRNEITTGNFIFRVREFEIMEMEFFCKPGTDDEWFDYWQSEWRAWYVEDLGLRAGRLRMYEHPAEKRAHYSKGTFDVEYLFPFGWGELGGVANRTDYDLSRHQEYSGKDQSYLDPVSNERYLPYVIEPTTSVDRSMIAVMVDAYDREEVRGEERVVLRMHPDIAPFQVAVLPLSKKPELSEVAHRIEHDLRRSFATEYDETQSIGRRYRRQDEIGTPLAVTVDFDSLQDQAVTIRERDTMEQVRVPMAGLEAALREQLDVSRRRAAERAQGSQGS